MAARPALTTEAVVLRSSPYRDADLIVTLYTRERGKLAAIARSARRSKKRFGGALGLLTLSRVEIRRSSGAELWTLQSAAMLRSFATLATDMAGFAHASYGTELVRELTAAEEPDERILALLVELYATLAERGVSVAALRGFELRLLDLIGLAPVLDRCVGCGRDDLGGGEGDVLFDPVRGGVVCDSCRAGADLGAAPSMASPALAPRGGGASVRRLSGPARAALVAAQRADSLADARRAWPATTPPEAAREARDTALSLILAQVGKPLRSLEFIAKVSGAQRDES